MRAADIARLRIAAALAVVVLAVLSRGDASILAALLVMAAWRLPALVVLPALLASSWRWGSTSLDALAGAQAVLGPAGWVGPAAAATASWLAAASVLCAVGVSDRGAATSDRDSHLTTVLAAAAGVTAAALVAGPGAGDQLWIRALAGFAGTGVAWVAMRLRRRAQVSGRALDGAALAAAVGAVLAASRDAPPWSGIVDASAVGEGAVVSAAALALVTVGLLVSDAMGNRRA